MFINISASVRNLLRDTNITIPRARNSKYLRKIICRLYLKVINSEQAKTLTKKAHFDVHFWW